MKSLSLWAHHHAWIARILIVIITVLLSFFSIVLGLLWHEMAYYITPAWTWLFLLLSSVSCATYPSKKNNPLVSTYWHRKSLDFFFTLSSCFLLTSITNQLEAVNANNTYRNSYQQIYIHAVQSTVDKPVKGKIKKEKRATRQWVKTIKGKYQQADDTTKILLVSLVVIVALGLALGVAALSCNIACNGSGIFALIVLIGGIAGIALLARLLIKRIRPEPKRRSKVSEPTAT